MKKALLILLTFGLVPLCSAQLQNFIEGDTAPNFTVITTDLDSVTLYDVTSSGQFVVLQFFVTDCTPCETKADSLGAFYHKYGCNANDVFVLGLDMGDTDADVTAFRSMYGGNPPFPMASGAEGMADPVDTTYRPETYPTIVVIDTNNVFLSVDVWPFSIAELEAVFPDSTSINEAPCFLGLTENDPTTLNLNVFPNPTNGEVNLQLQLTETSRIQLAVFDMAGREVFVQNLGTISGEHTQSISLEALPMGNYHLQVSDNHGRRISQQLVVLK